MQFRTFDFAVYGALLLTSQSLAAAPATVGGDLVEAGGSLEISQPSPRDLVASGFSVSLTGLAAGDVAVAGFDLDIQSPVGDDLYAAGATIDIARPVGGDITAAGFSVRLRKEASAGGNARLIGANVSLDGEVGGALAAAGGTIVLNGPVAGDARLVASEIRFVPDATVGGNLVYRAPAPLAIPASVIPPERVTYEHMEESTAGMADEMRYVFPALWPSFATILMARLATASFFTVAAALFLSFAPAETERMRRIGSARPFRSMLAGLVALGALVGLIPVCAITLVGIPLIPVLALGIMVPWIAGYLLGVYLVAWNVATSLHQFPNTMAARLTTVFVGILIAATMNFVPVAGWLLNLMLVVLGVGAVAIRIVRPQTGEVDASGPRELPSARASTL